MLNKEKIKMAKQQIVYILTNPSLAGWLKIGCTTKNDIKSRLSELNNSTAIPLDFRVKALLKCDNAHETEKHIHQIFDAINPEIHAIEQRSNGSIRKKEFFQITPEKACEVMQSLVALAPDRYELEIPEATPEEQDIENIVKQVAQEREGKRSASTFEMLNIPVGDYVEFHRDPSIKCKVLDDNNVEYKGEPYALSTLAEKLIKPKSPNTHISGWKEFYYKGESLRKRRLRLEAERIDSSSNN